MKVSSPKQRRQAGDTIVEVLIAIAIVSVVLVGAFVVSNRSTQAVQDSAEHSMAQQLLQGQVEELRSYVQGVTSGTISPIITAPQSFCMTGSLVTPVVADTNPSCSPTNGGAVYKESILLNNATSTYDCTITWTTFSGNTAKEELLYRIQVSP